MSPRLFNYVIMALYICNSAWWAFNRNWPQALYWLAAFQITLAVTWSTL